MKILKEVSLSKENQEIIREYQIYLLTMKHLSENSIISYVLDIHKYLSFLEQQKIPYSNIKKEHLIEYLNKLDKEKYAVTSVMRKISAIKSFHTFLTKVHHLDNIADRIEMPRHYQSIPNILSIEEMEILLDIPTKTNFDYRNKAMLELMYATGLRVSELVNLKIPNLDLDNKIVRVIGKGNKERIVPIGEVAIKYLNIYLSEYRNSLKKKYFCDNVFLNNHGKGDRKSVV